MAAKNYSLKYDGYWREININGIPRQSGIYSVYACKYSVSEKTVSIRKLIYIGESENVNSRINGHEKWPDWRRHLQSGEELCLSFAPINIDRVRAEAAMIHHHKPPVNTEYVKTFPYDATTMQTSGMNSLLSNSFTVYQKQHAY